MQRRSDSCGSDEASPGEESGELAADRRLQWIENSLHAGSTRFDDIHCLLNLSAFLILAIFYSQTWSPLNNKKFETLSYLPPLSEESIAKEIDYMIGKGWVPCLEFDEVICTAIYRLFFHFPVVSQSAWPGCLLKVGHVHRSNSRIPGYYDGRYWTMWKLPMFGCTDASQVLEEIRECRAAYPGAFVRLLGFDNKRQCQCISFVIQKPQ